MIIVSALSLSLRDKERFRDWEIERAWQFLLNNQFCLDALSTRWKIDYSNRVKKINAFYLKLGYNFVILKLTLKSRHIRLWSLYPVYQSSRKLGKLCLQLSEWRGEFGPQQPNCRNHQVLSQVHTYFRDTWDGKFKLELFYLNSTLNFGIPTVLVFQLEVYYKVDRLLTGLTAQQKGTTARWYSNKTSLPSQNQVSNNNWKISTGVVTF